MPGFGCQRSGPRWRTAAFAPIGSPIAPLSRIGPRRLEAAAEERVGGAADPQPARRRVGQDRQGVVARRRERLLRVDVLAGRERRPRDVRVGHRRRQVEDDLDRRVVEERLERGRRETAPGRRARPRERDRDPRRRPAPRPTSDAQPATYCSETLPQPTIPTRAGADHRHRPRPRARPRPTRKSYDSRTASIGGPSLWSNSTISHSIRGMRRGRLDRRGRRPRHRCRSRR